MTPFRLLDLFSGIGGFSLGLERSGAFKTVAFCEIEPFPRRVLAKHWPKVPVYDDVRTLTADTLARDGIAVDAICGGFPCQDISFAGNGGGLEAERSGLWYEYARIIGELRPRIVVVENVGALLSRGLDAVLGTLASLGYDAEWHCIPASYVGAPHRRDRIWIVAHAVNVGRDKQRRECVEEGECSARKEGRQQTIAASSRGQDVPYADGKPEKRLAIAWGECRHWEFEPDVGRMAHGVPFRVDRLRSLGNAVVPQIPEMIGRAIAESLELSPT